MKHKAMVNPYLRIWERNSQEQNLFTYLFGTTLPANNDKNCFYLLFKMFMSHCYWHNITSPFPTTQLSMKFLFLQTGFFF